jgi:hypothetical protein
MLNIEVGECYRDDSGGLYMIEKKEGRIVTYKNEWGLMVRKTEEHLRKELEQWNARK